MLLADKVPRRALRHITCLAGRALWVRRQPTKGRAARVAGQRPAVALSLQATPHVRYQGISVCCL